MKITPIFCTLFLLLFFYTDSLAQDAAKKIFVNQEGFYPNGPKKAIVTVKGTDQFSLIDAASKKIVFTGLLGKETKSKNSSLVTRSADFSEFKNTGDYYISVGEEVSWPFKISRSVHTAIARSSLKGFYFQRVSEELKPEHAGKWARSTGHPDTVVMIHPSAATARRPAGTKISSPGGWYDAGDYNKYIVNSGISMGTLLAAYEDFPSWFKKLDLNIPETGNAVPDILNEALCNLRWMLTMQDPGDGGVYNKCTNSSFDGMVMPGVTKDLRYVVQKGTGATLDFAAVMAQAARIFSAFHKKLPGLSDSCLKASLAAWKWSEQNPALVYDQQEMNKQHDPDISTGGYGDRNFSDEWFWAATELYVTTKEEKYLLVIEKQEKQFSLPGWPNVGMMGYFTLLRNQREFNGTAASIAGKLKKYIIKFCDSLLLNISGNAFATVMGGSTRDFLWGSNAIAANQGIVLIYGYHLTKDKKYIDAALSNLDYILGRNATGYCFVTGAGARPTMNPHHRPSVADGIIEPVPGLLAGGPNPGRQDKCDYPFTEPETAYSDVVCSYASNEIAINWNAPLVYLANAIEALQFSAGYSKK